jgi:hypothetical protein
MERKDFGNATILALGHLLGSDFDWLGTIVVAIAWLTGAFIVNKALEMYERRNKN